MTKGTVVGFGNGKQFGFVIPNPPAGAPAGQASQQLFVSFNEISTALRAADLEDKDFSTGRPVSFDCVDDGKGPRPRAVNLKF